MEELAQTRQEYTDQRDLCAAQLQELHDEQAQYETGESQLPPQSQVDYAAVQVKRHVNMFDCYEIIHLQRMLCLKTVG